MTDDEFVELLKGVQAGTADKQKSYEKVYRECGEDLKAVLERASKKGILLTYEEVDEVIREIEAEEREKKKADGMSESQIPEDIDGESAPESGAKTEKVKQKEAPRGQKSTKRKLVLRDEEEQPVVKKGAKLTSQRLLGRGKANKAGPVDTVEVSSEEENTHLEKEKSTKSAEEQTGSEDHHTAASEPINSEPNPSPAAEERAHT